MTFLKQFARGKLIVGNVGNAWDCGKLEGTNSRELVVTERQIGIHSKIQRVKMQGLDMLGLGVAFEI